MNHAPDRSSAVVRPSNWIPAKGGPVETVMHVDPGIVPAQAHDRGFGLSQGYVESGTALDAKLSVDLLLVRRMILGAPYR